MKKRVICGLILISICLGLSTDQAVGYGYNFTFPFARRSGISGFDYEDHQAFDFGCYLHEKISAAQGGTVTGSAWVYPDDYHWCNGGVQERGNYVILDHGSGLTTKYYHLSNEGNTPPVGTQFKQGAYMAYGDNTGCSDGNHLHFATELNGTPFNPYSDDTDWISGIPIPSGYRDQNGVVQGPFALSDTKIRNYWATLEGSPGSPTSNRYGYSCSLLTQGYRQNFERGIINYCGSGDAYYSPYTTYYLPDIRYRQSIGVDFNSKIVVRNNASTTTKVNITIYYPDGKIFDTRTHTGLAARAIWILDVHDVISEPLMYYYTGTFYGSATVSANQGVSVLVMHHKTGESLDYTGIPSTIDTAGIGINPQVYIPAYLHNYYLWNSKIYVQNAGNTETTIYAYFYEPGGGSPLSEAHIHGVKPGEQVTFSNLYTGDTVNDIGSVKVTSSPSQNLAALVEHDCQTYDMSFEYEGVSQGGPNSRAPLLFKNYYNWNSSFVVQNISGTGGNVTLTFNPAPNPTPTPFYLPGYGQNVIYMGAQSFPDGWKGSARVYLSNGNIVAGIHHVTGNNIETLGYHGIKNGETTLYLPYVRNHPGGEDDWIASINVMNIGTTDATVDASYFDETGVWILSHSFLLSAGTSEELINTSSVCGKHPEPPPCEMPYSFTGSVVLSSSTKLVAGVHLADTTNGNHHGYSVP